MLEKTQGFCSLSSKNDSSNSSDRDEIFPKKRNRRRAGITQRSNLSEQESSNSSVRGEIFPKKRTRRRAGIAQRSNLSEQESSKSSDRGEIFQKRRTRRRAGIAQRSNLSEHDSSNSSDRGVIFSKKRNRRRAEIAQLYNLSEQDSSNSSEREVSPKKKSKGKKKTRMARHSSEHASSCTEEREKEELAVRQRAQKVFDVAELNKPESSEDVGTTAIELHEINQMTTQQQQSPEDLDCENNDDSVHPYLPNIYKPPINDTGKSILL